MDKQRVLQTFLDMVAIDSPSYSEAAMAQHCAQVLEGMGFAVRFDDSREATGSDTAQIIATLPATGQGRIAFSAHMDCVKPCIGIKPHIEDGVVRSDGTTILSADDKSGIAEIFEGIQSVLDAGAPHPEITVLLSVCEEQGVSGAPHFPDVLFDEPVLTLVLDAEGHAGSIVLAAPYHYTFTATFKGFSVHAGVEPEAGRNAIAMAAHAIAAMPIGRHDNETTSSVGVIQGGKATNIVPDECVVRGECRSLDEQKCIDVRDAMDKALRDGAQKLGGSVTIDWEYSYAGIRVEENDPDVQRIVQAARDAGLTPVFETSGGGSDANVLWPKGCKAIPLGTGMTKFHSLEESILLSDLEGVALLIEKLLINMGAGA